MLKMYMHRVEKIDWLIVMDDVSGIADKSYDFVSFLIIYGKFK